MQIGLGQNHVDMLLNIFVVSLFAAVTIIIQLANCLPTGHVGSNYINEKEKFNGNNGFVISSNNIPFKIQSTQDKNKPAVYGPSENYSSPSPLTQRTSHTHAASGNNSSIATAPTSATNPSMATAPTSATNPSSETPPTAMTTPKPHNY